MAKNGVPGRDAFRSVSFARLQAGHTSGPTPTGIGPITCVASRNTKPNGDTGVIRFRRTAVNDNHGHVYATRAYD
jgi:hypothetical protein